MGGYGSGKRPLQKRESITSPDTIHCMCCNQELRAKEFYNSDSDLYHSIGKIPYCKMCIATFYNNYLKRYKSLGYSNPDRKSMERICMMFDVYYSDKIYDNAQKKICDNACTSITSAYFQYINLQQYKNKNYDTTISEKYKLFGDEDSAMSMYTNQDSKINDDIAASKSIFGFGFENEDYIELYRQYCDWTARHECNSKAQEEVFKNICLTQLQLSKAIKTGSTGDAKDLSVQLQKWLDTGKLQPKQNSNESVSDTQTFGTLIDKWENTRPIPEAEEEFKDVDGIGKYIDVFFKGGLAKSLGLNIPLSDEYDEYMAQYTVKKPEYDEDDIENSMLHDAIFGKDLDDESGD